MLSLVAVIGKKDEPLYFWSEETEEEALSLKQLAHSALDVVDERVEAAKTAKEESRAGFESYLGKLMSSGDHEVFGYLSSTKIKVIVVCGVAYQAMMADGSPRNNNQAMRSFLTGLYGIYSKEVRNPLQPLSELCRSENFKEGISSAAQAFTASLNPQ